MRARVPQDVDLEDRLIYGLTPVRFGYLVVAGLGAILIWNLSAASVLLRLPGCLLLAGLGALLAWGRLAGSPMDRFLADALLFFLRNYRPARPRLRRRRRELVPLNLAAINEIASSPPPPEQDGG
jgi:PrgI family protein